MIYSITRHATGGWGGGWGGVCHARRQTLFLMKDKRREKLVRTHQVVVRFCTDCSVRNCPHTEPRAPEQGKLIGRQGDVVCSHWARCRRGPILQDPSEARTERLTEKIHLHVYQHNTFTTGQRVNLPGRFGCRHQRWPMIGNDG